MIKAIIYDMDGMVLHGTRFSDRYAKEFGTPIERTVPFFTGVFEECVRGRADLKEALRSGGWLEKWQWKGTVDELLTYWFHSGDQIDDRVLASVAEIRKKAIRCILAINQEKYRTAYARDDLGLSGHFDGILASCEIGYKKPHPKFFEAAMDFLQKADPELQPAEVMFWDDRDAHIAGALAFGFDAHRYTTFEEYQKVMAPLL